ncbi:shikimate dehydrogenase [Galbibacter sp. PAP.153]|uniref:shikimate dehydrogenase family protein n=1 Tax=Galbibacter sp. PAP.153 TaxID=3104623 RepID=UPI00300A2321
MDKRFGLLGRNISYSFSQGYFTEKFKELGLTGYSYVNFDVQKIEDFQEIINSTKGLVGFNITIPYKEAIFPYLTAIDPEAKEIGAVNVVKVVPNGLKGYNTDVHGFKESLRPHLKPWHTNALILGTGGASKAVAHALKSLQIPYKYVSRTASSGKIGYGDLNAATISKHTVIINCTPLGTFPNVEQKPAIPYQFLTDRHLVFDLIYNPPQTSFMKHAQAQGATAVNGHEMLKLQAEKAWEIWNEN